MFLRNTRARVVAGLLLGLAAAGLPSRASADGDDLAARTTTWLETLTPAQRRKAMLRFDSVLRRDWHYVPRSRRGLSLREMTVPQRAAALEAVRAALSPQGFAKVEGVLALEAKLHADLAPEARQRHPSWRDPLRFHLAVYGNPAPTGRWGLRMEGHHLSFHVTLEDGRIAAVTPMFFGANPVRTADGTRPLAQEEDLGRRLFGTLDAAQREAAWTARHAPADVGAGPGRPVRLSGRGVALADLDPEQRALLMDLVRAYVGNAPSAAGDAAMAELRATPGTRVRFLFLGSDRPGRAHAYRIEAPTLFLEYVNRGDHIHSVWRDPRGDFGAAGR